MPTTRLREREWPQEKKFLPFLGEKTRSRKAPKQNLDLFEAGLRAELSKEDTIEMAVTKIVRMALAAEFGAAMTKGASAEQMVATIVRGILSDAELRKQALIIIDQFAR